MNETSEPTSVAALTAEIVSAYVSNNPIAPSELAGLITTVADQLSKVGAEPDQPAQEKLEPVVSVRRRSARITSSASSAASRRRCSNATSRSGTT